MPRSFGNTIRGRWGEKWEGVRVPLVTCMKCKFNLQLVPKNFYPHKFYFVFVVRRAYWLNAPLNVDVIRPPQGTQTPVCVCVGVNGNRWAVGCANRKSLTIAEGYRNAWLAGREINMENCLWISENDFMWGIRYIEKIYILYMCILWSALNFSITFIPNTCKTEAENSLEI